MGLFDKIKPGAKKEGPTSKKMWEDFFKAVLKQEYDKALALLELIKSFEPMNSQVYMKIAELKQRKGDKAGAVAAYMQAARVIVDSGFTQKAQAIYKVVLRIDPKNEEARKLSEELQKIDEDASLAHLGDGGIELAGMEEDSGGAESQDEEATAPVKEEPQAEAQPAAAPAEMELEHTSYAAPSETPAQAERWESVTPDEEPAPEIEPAAVADMGDGPAQFSSSDALSGWDDVQPAAASSSPAEDWGDSQSEQKISDEMWENAEAAPAPTPADLIAEGTPSSEDDQGGLDEAFGGPATGSTTILVSATDDEGGGGESYIPSIFTYMSVEDLESLPQKAKHKNYTDKAAVVKEGETGSSMYIIKKGQARVTANIMGKALVLDTLGQGDFFGEVSFLTGKPRTATVTAVGELEVLEIDKPMLQEMLDSNPLVVDGLLEQYHQRAQDTIQKVRGAMKPK